MRRNDVAAAYRPTGLRFRSASLARQSHGGTGAASRHNPRRAARAAACAAASPASSLYRV